MHINLLDFAPLAEKVCELKVKKKKKKLCVFVGLTAYLSIGISIQQLSVPKYSEHNVNRQFSDEITWPILFFV